MSSGHKCKICGEKGNAEIKKFTLSSLEKCVKTLQIRRENKLKYHDIHFLNVSEDDGYHAECYKRFNTLKKQYKNQKKNSSEPTLASSEPSTSAERHGITDENLSEDAVDENEDSSNTSGDTRVCVFCDKSQKQKRRKTQPLHSVNNEETIKSLMEFMEIMIEKKISLEKEDIDLLATFNYLQQCSNLLQLHYHKYCYDIINNKYESIIGEKIAEAQLKSTPWHNMRKTHSLALEKTWEYVKEEIGIKKKMMYLSSICSYYNDCLSQLSDDHDSLPSEKSSQILEKQLFKKDTSKMLTFVIRKNKTLIIPTNNDSVDLTDNGLEKFDNLNLLQQEAWKIRRIILNMKKRELPKKFTTKDIIEGECTIPEELITLITEMGVGQRGKRLNDTNFKNKVQSICQDIIYFVSNGRIKTSKHLTLGLTIKSKTNSRDVVSILNRYGHCCSYNYLKGIETEAAYSAAERSQVCPEDIELKPHLCTGVAFDNFDRYVDTHSGKDTLHDTVGIIYQNIDNSAANETVAISDEIELNCGGTGSNDVVTMLPVGRKRRTIYDAYIPELSVFPKRPRETESLLSDTDELRQLLPKNLSIIRRLNLIWMISHALEIQKTPLWVGFNNLVLDDETLQQKVSYLTPINLPPKDEAVIIETMDQSLKILDECNQDYIQVTYDLAMAKMAFELQTKMHPQYKRLFIHTGAFHIFLAYFKAVGKYLDGCGLTHMMSESGVLADGSMNGFIGGTHYKRCNRLHQINYLALQILHFKEFCRKENLEIDSDQGIIFTLEEFQTKKSSEPLVEDNSFENILEQYSAFQKETLDGIHGMTAQYYMRYLNILNHYLMLQRSIRSGDFDLFKFILPKITNLFFVFNQQNYSRWLVKYHDNLLQVDKTHPGLEILFNQGYFGIKRTTKSFSRIPVDLTLEQTINADAARTQTGIIHMTNSIAGRQCWAKNHGFRTSIISHTYEVTGLKRKEDITSDLRKCTIERNNADLKKMIDMINENINPFDPNLTKNRLYNIASGTPVSDDIADFLLNVEASGDQRRINFISDVSQSKKTFYDPISRVKTLTFCDSAKKKVIKTKGKEQEIRMQRDLFGRVLGLCLQEENVDNINIEKIFSYPLTPIPTSMCHMDGAIHTTPKSLFQKELEKRVDQEAGPNNFDVIILDGFFLLRSMKNVPATYFQLSRSFLKFLLKSAAPKITVVFDQYFSPSIKDNERERRDGYDGKTYKISGNMVRPNNFTNELKNSKYKEALVEFFIDDWAKQEMAMLFESKEFNVSYKYYNRFEVTNGELIRTNIDNLSCPKQEEADTRMIYYVCQIECECNVMLKCNDSDILIIMLGNMHNIKNEAINVWIETGTGNNTRRINVNELNKNLGETVSKALPGFHALTGCDYNPSFFRRGKNSPFKKLLQLEKFQTALIKLINCNFEEVKQLVFPILEDFVCHIYSMEKSKKVNKARYDKFSKTYIPKKIDEAFLKKLKNFDASNLPPCQDELDQQLYRTYYIANVWGNAHKQTPTDLNPADCGWREIIDEKKYDFVWFTGRQFPSSIRDVLFQPPEEEDESNEDEDLPDFQRDQSEDEDYDEKDEDEQDYDENDLDY